VRSLPRATDASVASVVRPARAVTSADGRHVLYTSHGRRYLATVSVVSARNGRAPIRYDDAVRAAGDPAVAELADHLRYGSSDSFLLDMQGIDTFLYARAKRFHDASARHGALLSGLVQPGRRYLRVGAAGAPPTTAHPGGEVVECSLLDGEGLAGRSSTSSGYLPAGSEFSRAVALALGTGGDLLDGRSVYSHTAFLADRIGVDDDATLALSVEATGEGEVNVLDALQGFLRRNRIEAYAVRIFVRVRPGCSRPPRVVGRVLRRLPSRRFTRVEQATQIASEQVFPLVPHQELVGFGTHYRRFEPDWAAFRGGKPYEPRGHIHMVVSKPAPDIDQHHISHLRDLFIYAGADCTVLLTPVTRTVRIDPVVRRGATLVSRSSGRALIEVTDDFAWRPF
jgi:hypothetical protein